MSVNSITLQAALDKAKSIDATLFATHPMFNRGAVQVIHDEGTVYFFQSAFVRKWNEYFLIFTEHQSYHAFHEDEVQISEFVLTDKIKKLTAAEEKRYADSMQLYKNDPKKWWKNHNRRLPKRIKELNKKVRKELKK